LADEPPSHLVGPAIHKTKEQISRLFSEELGTDQMNDPQEMTWFARRFLRRKFFRADMGITGANFAVSQSGTIVLFENEGNIRLTTTLPKIHVALMGIEKVVPGLDELSVLMKLLARSCTGQKLPSYVSMISGPRRSGERDGPEEFHLVILDNGRSRILADPELRPSLYCIRCGACLNFCPVYLKIGGHAYGWVYSGPIGSILTPQLIRKKQAYALPHASTLCGACAEVCPVNIPLPEILLALRRRYAEDPDWKGAPPAVETGLLTLLGVAMRRRGPYVWILKMAWLAQKIFLKNGRSRFFSRLFNRIGPPQPVPLLAPKSFRQIWGAHGQAHKESEHEP
jgi:L-lactate dehydrogenase complex protein LldF